MRHQSIRVSAIAAFALLIALDCAGASASAHSKTHLSRKRPHHQVRPPPVQLIKCAALVPNGFPCWPDPGMMRLQQPLWHWHVDPPLDQPPEFGPAR